MYIKEKQFGEELFIVLNYKINYLLHRTYFAFRPIHFNFNF